MGDVMQSDAAAAHVLWMISQPLDWTGHTVGFEDIAAAGGPRVP
jgi:hypothetical protein